MANSNEAKIHIKKSAMTVVDALEKVGAKIDGVDHDNAKSHDASAPTGTAVHTVRWELSADTLVQQELRRLEQIGEVDIH